MLAMCASALYEKIDVQHALHQISLLVTGRSVPAVIIVPSASLKSTSYAGGWKTPSEVSTLGTNSCCRRFFGKIHMPFGFS